MNSDTTEHPGDNDDGRVDEDRDDTYNDKNDMVNIPDNENAGKVDSQDNSTDDSIQSRGTVRNVKKENINKGNEGNEKKGKENSKNEHRKSGMSLPELETVSDTAPMDVEESRDVSTNQRTGFPSAEKQFSGGLYDKNAPVNSRSPDKISSGKIIANSFTGKISEDNRETNRDVGPEVSLRENGKEDRDRTPRDMKKKPNPHSPAYASNPEERNAEEINEKDDRDENKNEKKDEILMYLNDYLMQRNKLKRPKLKEKSKYDIAIDIDNDEKNEDALGRDFRYKRREKDFESRVRDNERREILARDINDTPLRPITSKKKNVSYALLEESIELPDEDSPDAVLQKEEEDVAALKVKSQKTDRSRYSVSGDDRLAASNDNRLLRDRRVSPPPH
ncbi:MAG: hypothetical protein QW728_04950, partial [Thermoplasmata archaeon]